MAAPSPDGWRLPDALIKLGECAVEPLMALLMDAKGDMCTNAAYALLKIGDPRAVGAFIDALNNGNESMRWWAARLLGEMKDKRAVEPLIAALKDDFLFVRKYAAQALGEIGDARAVEPLIVALRDPSKEVRDKAAQALDLLGWVPGREE